MEITMGMHFDGHTPTGDAALGESIVGPLGMLQLLEARLGLSRPSIRPVERLVEARQALAAWYAGGGNHGNDSFERDSLAVAELFLRQRDELMMAGWDGKSALEGSLRLEAIHGFSQNLSDLVCQGEADRLAAIAEALEQRPLRWESVTVVEPLKQIPRAWQKVLDQLDAVYDAGSPELQCDTDEETDLGRFKKAIAGRTRDVELKRDGSLEIVTAHSEWTLAQALQQMAASGESVLVTGGSHSDLLDRALQRADQPTIGVKALSLARAIPQVLGLALRLRWKPLDPQRLLEFLEHPVSPVTHVLRHRLSKALLNAPGVGGKTWKSAITETREKVTEKHLENPDDKSKMMKRIDQDLQDWIEIQRYDEGGSAPAAELADTCAKVAAWASRQLGRFGNKDDAEAALFRTLSADAGQLGALLQSMDDVSRPELDRLLEETLGHGSGAGVIQAELGHVRFVQSPAGIHESSDTVLWWNAEEPGGPSATFWTGTERSALAELGVHPPEAADLFAAESTAWMRPLFAARKRLALFLPLQRAGASLAQHPLISRLKAMLDKKPLPRRNLDREFESHAGPVDLESRILDPLALPMRRRWWQLPEGISLPPRAEESFTSIEKFIYSPYRWALEYAARIRPGSLGTDQLECGPRLYGSLIHRLVEDLFNEPPPLGLEWLEADFQAVESWVRDRWETLLEEEGMPLLVLGRQSERARVLAEAIHSIQDLVRLCQTWEVAAAVADDRPEPGLFQGSRINGYIDLVLTRADGQKAIVDLKYGGRRDKERQVKEGRPLQLAVYGFLLSGGNPPFAPGAFYILADQKLVTADTSFFTGVSNITPSSGNADPAAIWEEFEQIWEWRRKQLDDGKIEITVEGTEPDEDSEPPLPHWTPPKGSDKYNDHAVLTGF